MSAKFSAVAGALALSLLGAPAATVDDFQARVILDAANNQLPYRLFVPVNYDNSKKYPLVLFLHGAGERGSDNRAQLAVLNGGLVFVSADNQVNYPCFMVAPQVPLGFSWETPFIAQLVLSMLAELGGEFSVDADRLYVTGLSMGGYGTWNFIISNPNMFAAAVPMSAGGNPALVNLITHMPIWNFHALNDGTVPVAASIDTITALRIAGGRPIYTQYQTGGHGIWPVAYNTPGLMDWVMRQRRGIPAMLPPLLSVTNHLQTTIWNGSLLNLAGTADDGNMTVTRVNWEGNFTPGGMATGTSQWSIANIRLRTSQTNRVLITAQGTSWFPPWGGNTTFNDVYRTYVPPCAALPAGAVNWWKAEGDTAAAQEGNPALISSGVTFAPGSSGLGFRLNGIDASLKAAATPALDVGQGPGFTLEAWINPNDVLEPQPLLEWNDASGNAGVSLWVAAGQTLGGAGAGSLFADVTDHTGGSHVISTAPDVLFPVVFQHVALTYDRASGRAALYVDGNQAAEAIIGTIAPRTGSDLYFGYRPSGLEAGTHFAGVLDEIALYNRALAETELQAIYQAGVTGKCPPTPLPPQIVSQPQGQTVLQGESVTFTVSVTGSPPFGYRWRRNGSTIVPFGVGTPTLTLNNVQTDQAGNYTVVITNAIQTAGILSATAALTVLADFDGDHIADNWETLYGLDPMDPADAAQDTDGDGASNRDEYLAGTNPTNAVSRLEINGITLTANPPAAVVRFLAVSNRTYTVEFSEQPQAWPGTRLADVLEGTETRWVDIVDPINAPGARRFYRLVTPRRQ